MKTAYDFLRGTLAGFVSIALFYLFYISSLFIPDEFLFPVLLFFCIANGFFAIKIIYREKTLGYKIISLLTGFLSAAFFLIVSLILQFPGILADYFIYGEGGGGLEPGGWLAFNFFMLIYFVITVVIFMAGMVLYKK